ncbi:hypothetical protein PENTCL1PPCAC_3643 [Pristionchus entomophagus]|uniref:C2H2-type domain-containing protein n=1 Tax=Pristionchus entomophagus TaxID=358040 RepID=A0AAV5SEH9_9BILA|nr:hypothetical protein PENTCL1PPCAC_3643 [Pristionchus entomophagus]
MASDSAPGPSSTSVRRTRFKPVTVDPLSRVIYTQTLTALKPLRTTTLDDPKALRSTLTEHRNQLSTLVSTISAADAEGLDEQQKLALNLGKLATLFSKRLASPLNTATFRRPTVLRETLPLAAAVRRPTVPPPDATVARKRAVAPVAAPAKKIKDEPLDDDEPCCSTSNGTAASTNETLSSLLDAQLRSMQQQPKQRVAAAPHQTRRPTVMVARAAPGTAPVRVVVANRNGGAAARVVAVRRPVPGQTGAAAAPRPTVPANCPAPVRGPVQRVAAATAKPTVAELRAREVRRKIFKPVVVRGASAAAPLSKRLQVHPDAAYGCCEVDKPEKHACHACPFCGLMVKGAARVDHVRETHPDRYVEFTPFICILKECDYRTTSRAAVKRHCLQVHSSQFDEWERLGRFKLDKDTVCPLCVDACPIAELEQLRMHVRAVHDMMPTILCGSCCETCTTTSELFLHWFESPFCDGNAKLLDCRQESFLALFA